MNQNNNFLSNESASYPVTNNSANISSSSLHSPSIINGNQSNFNNNSIQINQVILNAPLYHFNYNIPTQQYTTQPQNNMQMQSKLFVPSNPFIISQNCNIKLRSNPNPNFDPNCGHNSNINSNFNQQRTLKTKIPIPQFITKPKSAPSIIPPNPFNFDRTNHSISSSTHCINTNSLQGIMG